MTTPKTPSPQFEEKLIAQAKNIALITLSDRPKAEKIMLIEMQMDYLNSWVEYIKDDILAMEE